MYVSQSHFILNDIIPGREGKVIINNFAESFHVATVEPPNL